MKPTRSMKCISKILSIFLVLSLIPIGTLADPVGESIHFPKDPNQVEYMSIEHMSIVSIVLTRILDEYISLDICYKLPETMTDEAKHAAKTIRFELVSDSNATTPLTNFVARADYAFSSTGAISKTDATPGESYQQESQWGGLSALPAVVYIRPYYVEADMWGAAIPLVLSEGMRLEVEKREDVIPPLTDTEGRKNING